MLDSEYDLPSNRKADKAASKYEYCGRQTSQPMSDYIMMLKTARREMEREDPGTVLSEVVSFARHLLRRSGLSQHDQRSVLAACGARWSASDIESASKLLCRDIHTRSVQQEAVPPSQHGERKRKRSERERKTPWGVSAR
eukprot:5197724-Amphidinium_carterae.2